MSLICETVMADNMRDLRRGRDASSADLVELRLDGVADVDVAGALEGRTRPVLLTCRAAWEGGRFNGSEEARLRILGQAIAGGAEYVDVEWRANRQSLPQIDPARLVLSHHDFSGPPDDLASRIRSMRAASPSGIVKTACTVGALADLVRLRAAIADDGGRRIVIGMGSAGLLSRVCPGIFGSEWTYGGSAAPGQLSMNELTRLYRVQSQSKSTRLFALTGMPLGHSASPSMHNAAFEASGIDAVYVPLETDDARAFLDFATTFGVEGVSVTAPLKSAWSALGVETDERGRAIGAVNTLRRLGDSWSGTNFDVEGFLAPLHDRGVALAGRRCVVLGAGGAARAAVWALVREGARVEVSARREPASAILAAEMGATSIAWPPATGWDLLVNATPVGTSPAETTAPLERSHVIGGAVYDLVYHPRRTQLLKWADEAGALTIEGLDMLVAQAALQFEEWIGRPAPRDVMRAAAEEFLDKAQDDEADNV